MSPWYIEIKMMLLIIISNSFACWNVECKITSLISKLAVTVI